MRWVNRLGKKWFPRLRRWERRRNMQRIIWGVVAVLAFMAVALWLEFSDAVAGR
jgi:hypothetical protein